MNLSTPFSPLKAISWLPVVGFGLLATANIVSSIIGVAQLVSPDTAIDLDEEGMMSVWLMLQGLIYLGSVPLHLVVIVGFLIWLYRAHANLDALGARNLEFTPGWAVGWWFIPFANLVKPYQAVREVWYESDPDADPNDKVFLTASLRTAPTYMGVWWAMWLISNIAT
ncbi:MAG TPA: DUF4328 domain-containing protein, partial [Pyrinomonadaceae bacterium]|nr:DUF4328 domain-containing protein [Pyrinomonadaceae bacterium]